MDHACAATASPPAREAAFSWRGRSWIALLWWCSVEDVWDVVVYETRAGKYRWQCSGVALKRFVEVTGSSTKELRNMIWNAIEGAA